MAAQKNRCHPAELVRPVTANLRRFRWVPGSVTGSEKTEKTRMCRHGGGKGFCNQGGVHVDDGSMFFRQTKQARALSRMPCSEQEWDEAVFVAQRFFGDISCFRPTLPSSRTVVSRLSIPQFQMKHFLVADVCLV